MMNTTISLPTVQSALSEFLDTWQDWSDETFDEQYREAILTLIEGLGFLVVFLFSTTGCWLLRQVIQTICHWLAEAAQSVPVLNGWWLAPFVLIQSVRYSEKYWRELSLTANSDILEYELSWAWDAEPLPVAIG